MLEKDSPTASDGLPKKKGHLHEQKKEELQSQKP
jgi:hypothetical protein